MRVITHCNLLKGPVLAKSHLAPTFYKILLSLQKRKFHWYFISYFCFYFCTLEVRCYEDVNGFWRRVFWWWAWPSDQGHKGCSPTSSSERAQFFPSFWCWESHTEMEPLPLQSLSTPMTFFRVHLFRAKSLSGPLVLENAWKWVNLYVSFRDLSTSGGGKCGKSCYLHHCHQKAVTPDWASNTDLWHVMEDKSKIAEQGLAVVEAIMTWLCLLWQRGLRLILGEAEPPQGVSFKKKSLHAWSKT